MRLLLLLMLCASIVHACGNFRYVCSNDNATPEAITTATKKVCDGLGESTCACSGSTVPHCDLPNYDRVMEFAEKCQVMGDEWYFLGCEAEYDQLTRGWLRKHRTYLMTISSD